MGGTPEGAEGGCHIIIAWFGAFDCVYVSAQEGMLAPLRHAAEVPPIDIENRNLPRPTFVSHAGASVAIEAFFFWDPVYVRNGSQTVN